MSELTLERRIAAYKRMIALAKDAIAENTKLIEAYKEKIRALKEAR